MQSSANIEARWSIASEQLETVGKRAHSLTLDTSQLDIPESLSSLSDYAINEQLAWLGRLKKLHVKLGQIKPSLNVN